MGARGPIPKSAEARQYEGSAAHRPLPSPRSGALSGIPERPKGMPAAPRRFWSFYTEQMALQGTLRPIDGPSLEMICELHADLQQLQREKGKLIRQRKQKAKAEGRQLEGGAMVEFEMTTDARRLESTINGKRTHLRALCDRYGLNPMAGSRLQANEGAYPMAARTTPGRGFAETNDIEARIQ